MPLRTPYSSSKYAIRGLSDTLAIELGEYGVRVNAILPGLVAGPRGERVISEQAAARGMSYENYLPLFLRNVATSSTLSTSGSFLGRGASTRRRERSGRSSVTVNRKRCADTAVPITASPAPCSRW